MIKKISFLLSLVAVILCTSCGSKMKGLSSEYFTVTPQVLEVVGGKVHVRDEKGKIMDDMFWYDNDIAIEIEKYRLDSCDGGYWKVCISYINTNPPVQKGHEDKNKATFGLKRTLKKLEDYFCN